MKKKAAIAGEPPERTPRPPHRGSVRRVSVASQHAIDVAGTGRIGSLYVKRPMPAPLRAALVPAPTEHAAEMQHKQEHAEQLLESGNDAAALPLMEEVLAAKIERGDTSWAYAERVAIAYNQAAMRRLRTIDRAEFPVVSELLRAAETLLQESPAFSGFHPLRVCLLSATSTNYAAYLRMTGDDAGALAVLNRAEEEEGRLPSSLTLINKAAILHGMQRQAEAERCVDCAVAIARHHIGPGESDLSPVAREEARQHYAAHIQEQYRLLVLAEITRARLLLSSGRTEAARSTFSAALLTARSHLGDQHQLTHKAREAFEQVPLYDSRKPPAIPLQIQSFAGEEAPSQLLPFALRHPPPAALSAEAAARAAARRPSHSPTGGPRRGSILAPDAQRAAASPSPVAASPAATEQSPSGPLRLPDIRHRPSELADPRRQSEAPARRQSEAGSPQRRKSRAAGPIDTQPPAEQPPAPACIDRSSPERFLRLRDFEQRSAALTRKFREQQTPRLALLDTRPGRPARPGERAATQGGAPRPLRPPGVPVPPAPRGAARGPHGARAPYEDLYQSPALPTPGAKHGGRVRDALATPYQPQGPFQPKPPPPRLGTADTEGRRVLQQEWNQRFTAQAMTLPGAADSDPGGSEVCSFTPGTRAHTQWSATVGASIGTHLADAGEDRGSSRVLSMSDPGLRPAGSAQRPQPQSGGPGAGSRLGSAGTASTPLSDGDWSMYEVLKAQAIRTVEKGQVDQATGRALRADLEEVRRLSLAYGLPAASSVPPLEPLKADPWTNPEARQHLFRAVRVQLTIIEFRSRITLAVSRRREETRRRRHAAATQIQRGWIMTHLRRDAVLQLHELRRRRVLRQQHIAATHIQRVSRGRVGRRRCAARRAELHHRLSAVERWERRCELAATLVQAVWRGCLARDRVLLRDDAAASIQYVFRMWRVYGAVLQVVLCRRRWRGLYLAAHAAARRIQLQWRGSGARKAAAAELLRRQLAIRSAVDSEVEAGCRDWAELKARRRAAAELSLSTFARARHSVRVVSRAARVGLLRDLCQRRLARLWRCHVARQRTAVQREDHARSEACKRRCEEVHEAATQLAAAARGMLARREAARRRTRNARRLRAAGIVQRAWRGHRGRERGREALERRLRRRERYLVKAEREYAARRMQCAARAHLARREVERVRTTQQLRHCFAQCVQRCVRRYIARRRVRDLLWERFLCREELAAAEGAGYAAVRIQTWARWLRARSRVATRRALKYDKRAIAAACIQRMARSRAARSRAAPRRAARDALRGERSASEARLWSAVTVQAWWRGCMGRWHRIPAARRTGPPRMRGGFAWQAYSLRLDHLVARRRAGAPRAVPQRAPAASPQPPSQKPPRRPPAPRRRPPPRGPRPLAMLLRTGGDAAGTEALQELLRDEAARCIGGAWRESKGRRMRRDARRGLLRKVWLKSLWRRSYRKVVEGQRLAATLIQATWRGARVRLSQVTDRMRAARRRQIAREWALGSFSCPPEEAAAGWSGPEVEAAAGRCKDAVRYANWAALHLQTWWRQVFARLCVVRARHDMGDGLRAYDQREEREFAATRIQKAVRGHSGRVRVQRMHRAADRIKGACRALAARRRVRALRAARLQHTTDTVAAERAHCAATIQCRWRCHRSRRRGAAP
eukprot:TRINITY_DN9541_c0_g1_i1.p1 TRINITY_DN9541_c0_g1~~TRINITY_DN9541_c0_g1_i1.p1  ORF type:complete len:1657 (+),score=465.52 TRINITY_DN9541_c0_g1_i1:102-5072(+)